MTQLSKKKPYEGHTVIQKGKSKHFMVKDFEKALVNITKTLKNEKEPC